MIANVNSEPVKVSAAALLARSNYNLLSKTLTPIMFSCEISCNSLISLKAVLLIPDSKKKMKF